MNKPKIISLGFAVPEKSYTQEEVFQALGYPHHFWKIFRDNGVEKRHFCIPPERIKQLSFQEQQEEYKKHAIALSKQAILNCLDGRNISEVKSLSSSTCTGILPGPVLGHYLAEDFNLENIEITTVVGQGCDGCLPGFRGAWYFTQATGKLAIAVTVELCSLTYYPESTDKPDPENKYELARGYSIFADGAAAVLLGYDDNPRHPEVKDIHTVLDTRYLGDLGYTWRNGRLRLLLSPKVPKVAPTLAERAVKEMLAKHGLKVEDIRYWVVHAAGLSILDDIQKNLGLSPEQLALSRSVLRELGNVSSATVGIIGKYLMRGQNLNGNCLMVTIGPGMQADCTWLYFGG